MIDVIPFAKKLKLVTSTPYIHKLYKLLSTSDLPIFEANLSDRSLIFGRKDTTEHASNLIAEKYFILKLKV